MADLFEVRNDRMLDEPMMGMPPMPEEAQSTEPGPLDTDAARRLLAKLTDWWDEARDGHADNRRQQYIDADYRDGFQWSPDDASVLVERGQVPLTFPLIKQMRDWITGTERRTRIDWNVLPRNEDDVETASVKKQLLKYIADVNMVGFERSRQFDDAVDVGIGWLEECYARDGGEEPIVASHVDWKTMWWDPFSRKNNLRDCRYIHRAKFVDLDYAIAMFPERKAQLMASAVSTLSPDSELLDLDAAVPQMFFNTTSAHTALPGSAASYVIRSSMAGKVKSRQRVLLIETWYRHPKAVKLIAGEPEWDGLQYDPANADMKAAIEKRVCSLVDSVTEVMRLAIWTPGWLLADRESPYKHGKYPFTPCWGYRRHRDGMPYGAIRLVRDSQDEYNKRRSKALFLLSVNRVEYEDDAFSQDDEEEMLEEYSRPDARVRLRSGALEKGKVKVTPGSNLAAPEISLMQEAKDNIYETAGVTRENTGQDTNAASGKAILAKQQQGAVTTAELFDNYRMAVQVSGQKMLSLCEQYMTLPKVFRILGADGMAQWIRINQLKITDEGQAIFENDITRHAADFVVDEMDYRETVRMAMADQLFELLGRLPPEVSLQLLDAAVELTDLPNKSQLAARIRAISGQPEPGTENSEEALAEKQRQRDEQAEDARLAREERIANIRKTVSEALRNEKDAASKAIDTKQKSLQTAGELARTPGLAPAADALSGASAAPAPESATEVVA